MAPVAYWEASTLRTNCLVESGGTRTGSDVTIRLSSFTAFVHLSVHSNGVSFFRRSVSGLAIWANPQMKGLWKPNTPSVEQTSLTVASVSGQSVMPAIFDGSMAISPLPSCTPRKVVLICSNSHFAGLRK
jgi:hypothetical protein